MANKAPFSDQELDRIIAACDKIPRTEWTTGTHERKFEWRRPQRFHLDDDLHRHENFRHRLFNMDRLHGNDVFLRAKKNGGEVYAYLPDWLRDRMNDRAKRFGNRPFIVGRSERVDTITDTWRRKINDAFALAGKFEEVPTPTDSGTRLHVSCCSAVSRLLTSLIYWEMKRRR